MQTATRQSLPGLKGGSDSMLPRAPPYPLHSLEWASQWGMQKGVGKGGDRGKGWVDWTQEGGRIGSTSAPFLDPIPHCGSIAAYLPMPVIFASAGPIGSLCTAEAYTWVKKQRPPQLPTPPQNSALTI